MQHYHRRHFQPAPGKGYSTTSALYIMACLFALQGLGITGIFASPMGYAILGK